MTRKKEFGSSQVMKGIDLIDYVLQRVICYNIDKKVVL
jgi:hypothetical protein